MKEYASARIEPLEPQSARVFEQLKFMDENISGIEERVSRLCGVGPANDAPTPSPVANGILEEYTDRIRQFNRRLEQINGKLSGAV